MYGSFLGSRRNACVGEDRHTLRKRVMLSKRKPPASSVPFLPIARATCLQAGPCEHEALEPVPDQDVGLTGLLLHETGDEFSAADDGRPVDNYMFQQVPIAGFAELDPSPPANILVTRMSLRLFASDKPTLRQALQELYASEVHMCRTTFHMVTGQLMCALFGIQGVRYVDLTSSTLPHVIYPPPFSDYMRDNALARKFGATRLPPSVCHAPGYDYAVDVELFSNLALLHGAVVGMSGPHFPYMSMSIKLMELLEANAVKLGLNLVDHFEFSSWKSNHVFDKVPMLHTGTPVHVQLVDSTELVLLKWNLVLLGVTLTLHLSDGIETAPDSVELPVVTGLTLLVDGEAVVFRETDLHGKRIVGTSTASYLYSVSDTPVADTDALFHDWFVERRGIDVSNVDLLQLRVHADPPDVPICATIVPVCANVLLVRPGKGGYTAFESRQY